MAMQGWEILRQLRAGIRDGTVLQSDVLHALSDAGERDNFLGHIERARHNSNLDLEIDDFPLVSPAPDNDPPGCWVSAWVWVEDRDLEG